MIFSGALRIHHLPNITQLYDSMTQLAPYHGTVTVNTELLLIISGSAMDDSPANTTGAPVVLASSLLKLQYTLHKVSRIAQRPIWSSMETVQKTRGNLKKLAPLSFVSPPHLTSPTSPLPDGHVELDYSEEERLRHMAKCPQNPSQEDIKDMHARFIFCGK